MIKQNLSRLLPIALGTIFLLSGLAKVLDSGELIIRSFNLGLGEISLLSPLLPPLEIILGLCLILNIYTKRIALVVSVFTFLFTIVFGYAYFFRGVEDCGCFGDWFNMSPAFTFIRNIFIIGGGVFIWMKSDYNGAYKVWKVAFVLISGAFSFAMTGFTVDNSLTTTINFRTLKGKNISETNLEGLGLEKGEYAVFLFSPSCSHCWNSTENIKQIKASGLFDDVIGLVAVSQSKALDNYKKVMKPNFEIKALETKKIDRIFGMRMPKLLLLKNGIIKHIYEKDDIPCYQLIHI